MQSGVLNSGVVDAVNLAPDPRATNPALYRSTGSVVASSIGGVACLKATRPTAGSMQVVVDKKFYSDIEGFKVGDKISWSADVYVTTPADIQMQVTFFAGGNEDTTSAITSQIPANGWVRHHGISTITAAPAGSYFEYRIHTVNANIGAGQGFYFRNLLIQKNTNASYFDGSTLSQSFTYEWSGAVNDSSSIRRLPSNTDSIKWVSRVLVDGTEREVSDWSIDRQISGGVPDGLNIGSTGIMQATGSVKFAGIDVEARSRSPFNSSFGWLPKSGDTVEIFSGDTTNEWMVFKGAIDQVSGDVLAGFEASVIDDIDKLSKDISHDPLLRFMPPYVGNGGEYRGVGLTAAYYLDFALRECGFNATPPLDPTGSIVVHGATTCWPRRGFLKDATASGVTVHPTTVRAPWGFALTDFTAVYEPLPGKTSSDPVQLTICVGPDHSGTAYVQASYGTFNVRMICSVSRLITLRVDNVDIVSLPMGEGTVVSALIRVNGTVEIRNNAGGSATGSASIAGGALTEGRIYASTSSVVSGFQISHPTGTAELAPTRHIPNAQFNTAYLAFLGVIDAVPGIYGRSAIDLLEEITKAKLSSLWIDETGVMRWAQADTLENGPVVRTITTLDDILQMGWKESLLQSSSKIIVKGDRPAITKGRYKNQVLYRGTTAESLKSNDELEIFLEPESGTTWIMPVTPFTNVGGATGAWSLANDPERSLVGLYYSADGGTTEATGLTCDISYEVINAEKIIVRYNAGTWPTDVEGVISTSPVNESLWPKNRDKELPKLVGQGLVQWSDRSVENTETTGRGPEFVFESGLWSNRASDTVTMQRYADYLRDKTENPPPLIERVEIVPDPRLQLGDVINIESEVLLGATIKGLIRGISIVHGDSLTMSLDIQVITVSAIGVTYEAWQAALESTTLTYSQFNALAPTPETYTQFNSEQ